MNNAVERQTVQFPWLAQITLNNDVYCFGAILSDSVILTAAHCITRDIGLMLSKLLVVRVGSNLANSGSKYYPYNFIYHSKYNFNDDNYYVSYDIALILLTTKIRFSRTVRKANIIPRQTEAEEELFPLSVASWGSTDHSGYPPVKKLGMTLMWSVPHKMCPNWQTRDGVMVPLPKHMSCIVAAKWNGNCIPSGSVVMSDNFLIGIVSTGRDIVCGSNIMPSTYTDVTFFRKWITEFIEHLEEDYIDTGFLRTTSYEQLKPRNASDFYGKRLHNEKIHDTGNDLLPKWLSAALLP